MVLRFSKYEGAGNDFILMDARESEINPPAEFIRAFCDRHKGVGADGLMILDMATQPDVDFKMRFYNADGGEGTMCGNGGRCITLFAHYLGVGGKLKTFEHRSSFRSRCSGKCRLPYRPRGRPDPIPARSA